MVAINEDRHVMAWDLVIKRDSEAIPQILQDAISKTLDLSKITIIDDFSSHKRAVKLLKYKFNLY